jgi:hypothetical protein
MNTCEARKGFLTLSNCENPGVTACSNCGRMMCPAHLAPQTGFTMCLDCAATNANVQETGEYDDVWAHRYRDDYYSSTGYTPVYGHSRSSFDRYDSQSFDDQDRDLGEDEVDRGGFDAS